MEMESLGVSFLTAPIVRRQRAPRVYSADLSDVEDDSFVMLSKWRGGKRV